MITRFLASIWKKLPPRARTMLVRSTQKTFTVSVAAVVVNEEREVLLLDHVIRPRSGWGIPGGFLAAGEQPEAALRREIREETGLELTDVRLYRVRTLKQHVEIIFLAKASGQGEVMSREIKRLQWFTPDTLPMELNKGQMTMIREIFSGEI